MLTILLSLVMLLGAPAPYPSGQPVGKLSAYQRSMIAIYDDKGVFEKMVAKTDLPPASLQRPVDIVSVNPKNHLGIMAADGHVVFVRRSDVAYSGASEGPCASTGTSPSTGSRSIAAADVGGKAGAGSGVSFCLPSGQ